MERSIRNEREVLYVIAEELGISRAQFDQFLRMMQGGAQFGGGYQQQQSGGGWQQAQRGPYAGRCLQRAGG
ncbi:Dna-J like membrane chaperone protein [Citrobacter koseri]|uniref:Dna-J like membrane chaperone protein n=1 Tax=Citrobacter koseri TaxID=545 RepID=A0A3S4I8H5_CITKO|nr:Dna-J like membrane chaperone protein [Citrobacter koseri]